MRYLKKNLFLFLFIFSLFSKIYSADNTNSSQSWRQNIVDTWNSSTQDLYIPLNTWHNRWTYTKEKIDSYNERPWGIGYGRSRFDERGDWHALYMMEFQDSHNKFEPIVDYGFQKNWYFGQQQQVRVGFGFSTAITARHDYNYISLPLILPILAFEYKKFSIQNAYVVGTYNNGNVLFTWVRWQLN